MTGVVEVGFVLAVLPLLVSSVEHYEDIYRPFTRYKNYDPLTRRIQLDLRSEKTAFLTETRLLLLATVGSESAEEMLADLKDPRWAGREYGAAGSQHLGDSLSVCMEVIRAIEEELQKIEASCEKFGILPEGRPLKPVLGVFHRDVWDRKKTKAKFALWAASLQGKLEELRKLNSQFRTHSKQTIRLTSLGNHSKQQQSNGILRTQIVQAASKELYQALVRATECHEAHSIHVRLDVHHVSETSATHSQLGIHPKSDAIPTWLAIESIRQDAFTKADFYQINSQSPFQDLTGVSPSAPTKQTHDHSRSSPSSMKSCGSSTMTNIGANGQICHQLQRYFQSEIGIQDGSGCLGYLESDSYYRHTVYLKPEKPESAKPRHRTLSQFMTSSVRHSRSGRLSTYEKLRLARQLAAAVLHFHATPLTIAPWRSTDVFFLVDIGENNKGPLLMEPHLSVQMRNEEPEGNEMSPQERAIIRNPQLFALGIVLLELAYQTSLEDLHLEYQTEIGSSPISNDFFLANRLTKDGCMSRELGVTYKEAVRRCIECDFGCGKDLSESTLQAAFYNSVVCELEKLEKHLEKIY